MSDFSFSGTAGTSQSTAKSNLVGNNVYEVAFDGCEIKDVVGVKDPTALYRQLILKFSNEDGAFSHTVWEPRPEDFERRETDAKSKDGKAIKILQPSNVESMMLLFKHAIDFINPTIAQKIDSKELNLGAKNWEELRIKVAKVLDAGKGAKTKIKLIKNKAGEAIFPGYFTGLTRDGVAYVKNNFIGPKVAFTTYEAQKINEAANATPTAPKSFAEFAPVNKETADLDMDFEIEGL